jgi:hypothetical protein
MSSACTESLEVSAFFPVRLRQLLALQLARIHHILPSICAPWAPQPVDFS